MNHKLVITGLQAELAKVKQELADLQSKYGGDVNGTSDVKLNMDEYMVVSTPVISFDIEPVVKPKRKPKSAVRAAKK